MALPDDRYAAVDLAEAVRRLADAAGIEVDAGLTEEIAARVGFEPPALAWAGGLARTLGWRPLRDRILRWQSNAVPWRGDVELRLASLDAADVALAFVLAGCDAPFSWDVLEAIVPSVSVDAICALEERGLLARHESAGIVTFVVPYCVRAAAREIDRARVEAAADPWLGAWATRAAALRAAAYGPSARATIAELSAAVPLAAYALFDAREAVATLALALWTDAADAIFFGGAIPFGSPAFARAVDVAGADAPRERWVRARLVAARADLEAGDPVAARALVAAAIERAKRDGDDVLVAEALRGSGWTELAAADLDAARGAFEDAARLAGTLRDPRGQADASAGLGMIAVVTGEPESARACLGEALATHIVMRDAPREAAVRGMMMLLPDADAGANVERISREVDELRASGQRWREALALARLGIAARARGDTEGEREHLTLARVAAAHSGMPVSDVVRSLVDAKPSILVGFEGRSLALRRARATT